jgi:hypothetical protein
MNKTEKNINQNNRIKLTIGSREVQGKMYKGTGFLINGTAGFISSGPDYDMIKTKFPWARAALEVTINSMEQTL